MLNRSTLFSRLRKDHAELAAAALERGDLAAAAGYLSKCGKHHRAAELYAEAADEDKAVLEAFRAALGPKASIEPDSTVMQAAELLASTGYRKQSVALYELAGAFHQAAKVALKSGQTRRAGQCFEKAKLWTRAATCYEKAGHPDEALRALEVETRRLRRVLQRLPDPQSEQHLRRVVAKRVELLTSLGRTQEAEDVLGESGGGMPKGRELEAAGDLRGAVEAYEAMGDHAAALRAIRRIPGFDKERMAEIMLSAGQALQAARVFNAVGRTERAADAFAAAGDHRQAAACWETLRSFEKAARAYTDAKCYADAARCYTAAGRPDLAREVQALAAPEAPAGAAAPAAVAAPPAEGGPQPTASSRPAPVAPAPPAARSRNAGGGLEVGQIVADRYRILERFERFGGTSYKAADRQVGAIVEVRRHPALAPDREIGEEERKELALGFSLEHPAVLRIYDLRPIDGAFYITQELADGERLDLHLSRRGALPLAEVKAVASRMAEALQRAHALGLLHRALRPGNVLLTQEGARITGFGLGRLEDPSSLVASSTSRAFLSPEQVRGESLDPRSDLYSAGVLIFAMLQGGDPEAGGEAGIALPPSNSYRPGLPVSWEVLLRRLLARDPATRLPDAEALRRSILTLPEAERKGR